LPRIPGRLLDSVFYLYPTRDAARKGERAGGTGFFLSVPLDFDGKRNDFIQSGLLAAEEHEPSILYAISNEHVVRVEGCHWARINTNGLKRPAVVDLPLAAWQDHPDGDDISVCAVGLSREYLYQAIPARMLLSKSSLAGPYIPVGPGDDVFFVGRFVSYEGVSRNTPTVRFGNISMMPHEPVPRPGRPPQESFLIEARSLSGYSGSPIFVYEPGADAVVELGGVFVTEVSVELVPMRSLGLLGIGWGHFPTIFDDDHDVVLGLDKKDKIGWVRQNAGMMGAVPAWRLLEMLLSKDMVKVRRRQAQDLKEKAPDPGFIEDSRRFEFGRDQFLVDLKKASRRLLRE
jgi:hypothetical protein